MTDDRKPRQFYIADDYDNGLHVEDKPTEGFDIKAIELEPTLQLMKEMGDILETSSKRNISPRFYAREVLEKYRKFLEGIEK